MLLASFVVGALIAAGCSKDDSETDATDNGAAGSSSVPTNNTGNGPPGFGSQSTGQTAAGGAGTPVFNDDRNVTPIEPATTSMCGSNVCSDRLVFGDTALQPCCTGSSGDDCGLETGPLDFMGIQSQCADLAARGDEDEDCPSLDYDDTVTETNLPGCCMPNGVCGVAADLLLVANFGCVDPREFFDLPDALAAMYGSSCEASTSDAGVDSTDDSTAGVAEDGSDASVADQ